MTRSRSLTRSLTRSMLAGLLAAVAFVVAPMLSAAAEVGSAIFATCRRVRDWAVDIAKHALAMAPAKAEVVNPEPQTRLLAARQFVLRFIKRETPSIESRYRMCPSI